MLLSILIKLFPKNVKDVAKKVRDLRNKWAHSTCGSSYWNLNILEEAFQAAIILIEVLQIKDKNNILLKIKQAEDKEYFSQEEVIKFLDEQKWEHQRLKGIIENNLADHENRIKQQKRALENHETQLSIINENVKRQKTEIEVIQRANEENNERIQTRLDATDELKNQIVDAVVCELGHTELFSRICQVD